MKAAKTNAANTVLDRQLEKDMEKLEEKYTKGRRKLDKRQLSFIKDKASYLSGTKWLSEDNDFEPQDIHRKTRLLRHKYTTLELDALLSPRCTTRTADLYSTNAASYDVTDMCPTLPMSIAALKKAWDPASNTDTSVELLSSCLPAQSVRISPREADYTKYDGTRKSYPRKLPPLQRNNAKKPFRRTKSSPFNLPPNLDYNIIQSPKLNLKTSSKDKLISSLVNSPKQNRIKPQSRNETHPLKMMAVNTHMPGDENTEKGRYGPSTTKPFLRHKSCPLNMGQVKPLIRSKSTPTGIGTVKPKNAISSETKDKHLKDEATATRQTNEVTIDHHSTLVNHPVESLDERLQTTISLKEEYHCTVGSNSANPPKLRNLLGRLLTRFKMKNNMYAIDEEVGKKE